MTITVALIESSPRRLRYLATQDSLDPGEDFEAASTFVIPNDDGPSPDLRTDILAVAAEAGTSGLPLQGPIRAALDGFGPIPPGPLTQAQARAIFNSDDPGNASLSNELVGRCTLKLTTRTGPIVWGVDAAVDGQGDPVIRIRSQFSIPSTCVVEIEYQHSIDR